jgi:hypothetical protein
MLNVLMRDGRYINKEVFLVTYVLDEDDFLKERKVQAFER